LSLCYTVKNGLSMDGVKFEFNDKMNCIQKTIQGEDGLSAKDI